MGSEMFSLIGGFPFLLGLLEQSSTATAYSYILLQRISRDQVILCLRIKLRYSQYRKY